MNLLKVISNQLRLAIMAKDARKKGKSARNGNAPSPYTKYHKTPYRYSSAYYDWKRAKVTGKPTEPVSRKINTPREYRQAAE